MSYIDFVGFLHGSTKRNYLERVTAHDKAACAEVASQFGKDYWDGERHLGYGGYHYDGRWLSVAEAVRDHYGLKPGMKILDVGCGKGFLLHEFMQAIPGLEVRGIDVSQYGIDNAKDEVSSYVSVGNAVDLSYDTDEFDFVVALGMLHNLYNYDLHKALQEIERVGRNAKYVMVEGYRNEQEKANLLYWQLTCRAFHTPAEWEWTFAQAGYTGDYGCIFFE